MIGMSPLELYCWIHRAESRDFRIFQSLAQGNPKTDWSRIIRASIGMEMNQRVEFMRAVVPEIFEGNEEC